MNQRSKKLERESTVKNTFLKPHLWRKINNLKPGHHACYIFSTKHEHRAVVSAFILRGIELNQKVIYIADLPAFRSIADYVFSEGREIEKYLAQGQLRLLTATAVYLQHDIFDPDKMIDFLHTGIDRALQEGYTALRITGEMKWVLKGLPGSDRLVEYESKLKTSLRGRKCVVLCQYDKRLFDTDLLNTVSELHPYTLQG